MITLESLTDAALLAHYNSRKNAHRAYERSEAPHVTTNATNARRARRKSKR